MATGGATSPGATPSTAKAAPNKKAAVKTHSIDFEEKYDYTRTVFASKDDPRHSGPPCYGHHEEAPLGRGSKTGCNAHAHWVACAKCSLRLRYTPAFGAHGRYRKAGPLPADVQGTLERLEHHGLLKDPAVAEQLTEREIALEGAEESLTRRLRQVQEERAQGCGKDSKKGAKNGGYPTAEDKKAPPPRTTAAGRKRYTRAREAHEMSETSDRDKNMQVKPEVILPGAEEPTVRVAEVLVISDEDASWNMPPKASGSERRSPTR